MDSCVHIKHVMISESELVILPQSAYSCELCGLWVKTKANLRAHHIKTHHILKSDSDIAFYSKQKSTTRYMYHCPVVSCKHHFVGGFTSTSRLKQHYQSVHMHKSFKCDKCNQCFSTPSTHAYHSRICGITHYCPKCPKSYANKKHLNQHFRRTGHGQPPPSFRSKPLPSTKEHIAAPEEEYPIKPQLSDIVSEHQSCTSILPMSAYQNDVANPAVLFLVIPLVEVTESQLADPFQNACPQPDMACNTDASSFDPNTVKYGNHEQPEYVLSNTTADTTSDYPSVSVGCGTLSPVNISTQTDFPVFSEEMPRQTQISVNTCTDDDDISDLFGSLFCDASVEANFPLSKLVTDPNEMELPSNLLPYDIFSHADELVDLNDPADLEQTIKVSNSSDLSCSVLGDSMIPENSLQTDFSTSFESVAMQTDFIEKMNAASATQDEAVDLYLKALLETPSPMVTASYSNAVLPNSAFHLVKRSISDAYYQDHISRFVDQSGGNSLSPFPTLHCDLEPQSSLIASLHDKASQVMPFNSVGLQSYPWPPVPVLSASSETQTTAEVNRELV